MSDTFSINIQVKKIGGKKYLYARDSVYIDKGKIVQKYKSLGRIIPGREEDNNEKLTKFVKEVKKFEIEERVKYWKSKIKNSKVFKYIPVLSIEKLRTELYRGRKSLGFFGKNALKTNFATDFIYNSNRIEGSKLPKKTVAEKIKGNTRGNNEVINTIKAIAYFDDVNIPCSLNKILEGQKILMSHIKFNQGIRKEPVLAGNSITADYKEIRIKIKDLMEWYQKNEYKIYPPELAFLFYYKFERIHPFPDGNGRIGRILMNNILKKHKYHPIIVWNKNSKAHNAAFLYGMDGKIDKFLKFMLQQMKATYQIFIDKIPDAIDIDQKYSKFFEPSRK